MDPGNLWAMLTARSPRMVVEAAGFGHLTPDDVRLALKDLAKGPMLMGMVFDAGDQSSLSKLEYHLWMEITDRGISGGWQYHKRVCDPAKPFNRKMAQLILIEMFGGKPCSACKATGHLYREAQAEQCGECSGRGKVKLTGGDRAMFCGCSRENWQRNWSGRYEAMHSMAVGWLGTARRHVRIAVNKFSQCA